MDGLIYLLNESGIAVQQLKKVLAERDQRIAELEAQLATMAKASTSSGAPKSKEAPAPKK